MSYPLPKDPWIAAYLDQQRKINKQKASVCHYCKNKSMGIIADGHKIFFVCEEHVRD